MTKLHYDLNRIYKECADYCSPNPGVGATLLVGPARIPMTIAKYDKDAGVLWCIEDTVEGGTQEEDYRDAKIIPTPKKNLATLPVSKLKKFTLRSTGKYAPTTSKSTKYDDCLHIGIRMFVAPTP